MNRRVEWLPPAEADLDDLHWQIAGDVAAAVKLFALTGVGTLVPVGRSGLTVAANIVGT